MQYLLDTDTFIYWMKDNPTVISKVLRSGLDAIAGVSFQKQSSILGAFNSVKVEHNVRAVRKLAGIVLFLPFDDLAQEFFGRIKGGITPAVGLPWMIAIFS